MRSTGACGAHRAQAHRLVLQAHDHSRAPGAAWPGSSRPANSVVRWPISSSAPPTTGAHAPPETVGAPAPAWVPAPTRSAPWFRQSSHRWRSAQEACRAVHAGRRHSAPAGSSPALLRGFFPASAPGSGQCPGYRAFAAGLTVRAPRRRRATRNTASSGRGRPAGWPVPAWQRCRQGRAGCRRWPAGVAAGQGGCCPGCGWRRAGTRPAARARVPPGIAAPAGAGGGAECAP